MRLNKKGQQHFTIASIGMVAITLLVAAIALGLGGSILDKIQGTQPDNSAATPRNESFAFPGNNSEIELAEERPSIGTERVCNSSDWQLTRGTDYNMTGNNIVFMNVSDESSEFNNFNITYSYLYGSPAYNSSIHGLSGIENMSQFIPVMAIVAIAAVVIGVVLVMFGRRM